MIAGKILEEYILAIKNTRLDSAEKTKERKRKFRKNANEPTVYGYKQSCTVGSFACNTRWFTAYVGSIHWDKTSVKE